MKNRSLPFRVLAIGLLLLLAPLLFLWVYMPSAAPALAIERFMPGRVSAVLRLSNPQQAWLRHWNSRHGPAPETALRAIFEAMDKWPRWVKKYGEMKANLRLKLFQQAFFQTVGEEAWLVFGEWGGDRPGDGRVGLVAFIRGNTPVRTRVGPLMDLLMDDYKVRRTRLENEPVYEYIDKRLGRSLQFCQVGGWICVSLRRRDAGPLPLIIRQAHGADGATTRPRTLDLMPPEPTSGTQALAFGARGALFWAQLDAFTIQRGRKFSKESRNLVESLRRQSAQIDRLTVAHDGDSILDLNLEMTMTGDAGFLSATPAAAPVSNFKSQIPAIPSSSESHAAGELAQFDLALPLARLILPPRSALETRLIKNKGLNKLYSGLGGRLTRALEDGAPREERIGLAAYASPLLIPNVLLWVDRPPLRLDGHSPAAGWAGMTRDDDRITSADDHRWFMPGKLPILASTPAGGGEGWSDFVDGLWNGAPRPPLGFAALNFRAIGGELDKIPAALMKSKEQKKFQRWRSTINALALAAGGAAARLDGAGNHVVLRLRTP